MTTEKPSHPLRSPLSLSSSSSSSATATSSRRSSAVKSAARSVAGVFIACLTPPEHETAAAAPPLHGSHGSSRVSGRKNSGFRNSSSSPHTTVPPRRHLKLTVAEILKATNNFSPALKIGQGGFGTVYLGTLTDGSVFAVKRARKSAFASKQSSIEFQRETQMLAQVEHLNLVRFYGFVEEGDEKILLSEYVPNGTLRDHLDVRRGSGLDFTPRLDIAIDVAHALTYLHTYTDHPIIHRDIKSSNILLTENLRAKVADFGFARLAADRDTGATHVSTQVKGTAGYLDPEYMKTYQLTEKSDVYSFGALLVELVTGRRPIETKRHIKERSTVKWAMKKFVEGEAIVTVDPRVERNPANNWAMEKILQLALQCLQSQRAVRPDMKRCVEILWSIRKEHGELSAPVIISSPPRSSSDSPRSSYVKEEGC